MIDKVITSLQNADNMQEINIITGLDMCKTDNWIDFSIFEENPELQQFISEDELKALKNKDADYIAFRFDD